MKLGLVFATSVALFFVSAATDAPRVAKYGFVNFEAAIAQEKEAQIYIKELEDGENKINQDEQVARVDIEKKMTNFRASVASLSEKARQEKETQLSNEIGMLQQQFTQRRQELGQKRQDRLRQLEDKNRLLLDSISKNGGFDMVFNAAALVYVSDDMKKNDLTGKLVESYNKAYPVKPEAAKKPTTPVKAPAKTPVKK
jgi:Skp family chaperone for outer membrane proteins